MIDFNISSKWKQVGLSVTWGIDRYICSVLRVLILKQWRLLLSLFILLFKYQYCTTCSYLDCLKIFNYSLSFVEVSKKTFLVLKKSIKHSTFFMLTRSWIFYSFSVFLLMPDEFFCFKDHYPKSSWWHDKSECSSKGDKPLLVLCLSIRPSVPCRYQKLEKIENPILW